MERSSWVLRRPGLSLSVTGYCERMGARLDTGSFQLPPRARRRVLVLGSNVDAVENLVLLLREMGHDVEFSVNAKEAIETARDFRPEFVLVDLALSAGNGYDAARRLRREAGLEGARIFALVGSAQQYDQRRSREAGCELHLVKPVDPAFLASLLAQGQQRTN